MFKYFLLHVQLYNILKLLSLTLSYIVEVLVFSFCFLFLLDCAFIFNLYPELKRYNLRQYSFLKPFVNPGNILAKFTTCTTRM